MGLVFGGNLDCLVEVGFDLGGFVGMSDGCEWCEGVHQKNIYD